MQIEKNAIGAAVFSVVFVALSFLVYTGKVEASQLGLLLAWLVPSPIKASEPKP